MYDCKSKVYIVKQPYRQCEGKAWRFKPSTIRQSLISGRKENRHQPFSSQKTFKFNGTCNAQFIYSGIFDMTQFDD